MAQTAIPESVLTEAHKLCTANRAQIERSNVCACFYCLGSFQPSKIEDWIDEPSDGSTATCPNCGIDAVLGDASGYELNEAFLSAMHQWWFKR